MTPPCVQTRSLYRSSIFTVFGKPTHVLQQATHVLQQATHVLQQAPHVLQHAPRILPHTPDTETPPMLWYTLS